MLGEEEATNGEPFGPQDQRAAMKDAEAFAEAVATVASASNAVSD